MGKLAKIGVWEEWKFIGVVIYGRGAGNSTSGTKYGLSRVGEVAELCRVSLRGHSAPVSKILAIAQRILANKYPKLRLLISFADMGQGHHGGIYQANGWVYTGTIGIDSLAKKFFVVGGVQYHGRSLGSRYGVGGQSLDWLKQNVDPRARYAIVEDKHRYLMPLDDEMRARIEPLRKPYPKREKQAMAAPTAQRRCNADLHAPITEVENGRSRTTAETIADPSTGRERRPAADEWQRVVAESSGVEA